MYHPMYRPPSQRRRSPQDQKEVKQTQPANADLSSNTVNPLSEESKNVQQEAKIDPSTSSVVVKASKEEDEDKTVNTNNNNNQNSNESLPNQVSINLKKHLETIERSSNFQFGIVDLAPKNSCQLKIVGAEAELFKDWLIKFKPCINILNLSGNHLSEQEAKHVNNSSREAATSQGTLSIVDALAQGLESSATLCELNLHDTGLIPKESLIILSATESCKNLRSLDWSYNVLDYECCKTIGGLITQKESQLTVLNLSHCQLDRKSVNHLLLSLNKKHYMREINLASYELNVEQAQTLLSILQNSPSLTSVTVDFDAAVSQDTREKIQQQLTENQRLTKIKVQQLISPEKLYEQAVSAITTVNEIWLRFLLSTQIDFENENRQIIEKQLGGYAFELAIIGFELKLLKIKLEILENNKDELNFDYHASFETAFATCLDDVMQNQEEYFSRYEADCYFGDMFIDPKNPVQKMKGLNKLTNELVARFAPYISDNLNSFNVILMPENSPIPAIIEPDKIILIKQGNRVQAYWKEENRQVRPIAIELTTDELAQFPSAGAVGEQLVRISRTSNPVFHAKVISACKCIRFQIDKDTNKDQLLKNLLMQETEAGVELEAILKNQTAYTTKLVEYQEKALERQELARESRYSLSREYGDNIEEILECFRLNKIFLDPNPSGLNKDKNSLLLIAVQESAMRAVKLLLSAGADPFKKNANGKSTFRQILDKSGNYNSTEIWLLQQIIKKPDELWGPMFRNMFVPENLRLKINDIKQKIDSYLMVLMSRQKWSWLSLDFFLVSSNLENRKDRLEAFYSQVHKIYTDITGIYNHLKIMRLEVKGITFGPLGRSKLYEQVSQALDALDTYLKTHADSVEESFAVISLMEAQKQCAKDKDSQKDKDEQRQEKERAKADAEIKEEKRKREESEAKAEKEKQKWAQEKKELENKLNNEFEAKLEEERKARKKEQDEMEKKQEALQKQLDMMMQMLQSNKASTEKQDSTTEKAAGANAEKTSSSPRLSTARNNFYTETRDSSAEESSTSSTTTLPTDASLSSPSPSLSG